MQQQPQHAPSVSDLYGTDEIEFLLEEIKDLEPVCCQLDDIQVHEGSASNVVRSSSSRQIRQSASANSFILIVPDRKKNKKKPAKDRKKLKGELEGNNRVGDEQKDEEPNSSFLSRVFGRRNKPESSTKKKNKEIHFRRGVGDEEVVKLVDVDSKFTTPVSSSQFRRKVVASSATDDDNPERVGGDNSDEIKVNDDSSLKKKGPNDFEIAGSSRAGEISLESPLGTVTSWDSHAQYRQRIGLGQMTWGVQLHCDSAHLKTPTGIVRILLVLSSAVCLACECSAGTVQVGLFLLPLIGRLRLMVFCALFSLLVTCLMLFLDISHIALMFPFNWGKVNAWMYLSIGLLFLIGSSLLVHMVYFAEAFSWVPRHTKDTLFVSAIFGYICAVEALLLSAFALCKSTKYLQVPEDQNELFAQDRELSPMSSSTNTKTTSNRRKGGKKGDGLPNHNSFQARRDDSGLAEGVKEEDEGEEEEDDETDENQVMLDDLPNHRGHAKPYIPAKRPDQAYNKAPTLGHHNPSVKTNNRYRQGYHYQPIASTSQQSPTFVLDDAVPSSSR